MKVHEVWQATWARLESKILAKKESVRSEILRADSRGDEPPCMKRKSTAFAPLAKFTPEGELEWNDELVNKIKTLATAPKKRSKTR